LTLLVDVNGYGQSKETMCGIDIDIFEKRFSAFGFNTVMIDGHEIK